MERFFNDPSLSGFNHVRNRILALQVQAKLYSNDTTLRLVNGVVIPRENLFAPKAGLLEPALAVFFVRSEALASKLIKESQQWCDDPETGEPINLVFDRIARADERELQIFDNVAFSRDSSRISLILPQQDDKFLFEERFPVYVLVDVQQYRVLTNAANTCDLTSF